MMTEKKMDWHLFWTAASVVVALGSIVIGCYMSLKTELTNMATEINTIKTVLIVKGIMPKEFASNYEVGI
jgi:hypothetical protein